MQIRRSPKTELRTHLVAPKGYQISLQLKESNLAAVANLFVRSTLFQPWVKGFEPKYCQFSCNDKSLACLSTLSSLNRRWLSLIFGDRARTTNSHTSPRLLFVPCAVSGLLKFGPAGGFIHFSVSERFWFYLVCSHCQESALV